PATIYAHRYDEPNDEATGIIGGAEPDAPAAWRFSIEVAKAWERTLDEAATPHTRKVKLRTSIVMSPDRGGPFDLLLRLVRLGLGGRSGDGRQDRKSTRLNSSHRTISYAVFCLKKKNK